MTRYTVNSRNTLLNIPLYVTALTVTGNTCNENNINVVDLSSFKFLRSVVIGSDCFQYVMMFSIVGLNWLESVNIGYRSFGSGGSLWAGSQFKIVNITGVQNELLNEVIIGENSLSSLNHP